MPIVAIRLFIFSLLFSAAPWLKTPYSINQMEPTKVMTTKTLQIDKAEHLRDLIYRVLPSAGKRFDPTPTPDELLVLKHELGENPVPQDLIALYLVFGSQNLDQRVGGVFFNDYLLSPQAIVAQMLADQAFSKEYDGDRSDEPDPEDQRLSTDYHPPFNCVPFLADGLGNFFAVDYAPGHLGKVGQIIAYGSDLAPTFIADSMDEFVDILIWVLENNKYMIKFYDNMSNYETISPEDSLGSYSQSLTTYLAVSGSEKKDGVPLWQLLPALW